MHNLHDAEAAENVKSIRRIPETLLPKGPARMTLVGMARDGYDVYAYTPLQIGVKNSEKRWNVWYNGQRYPLEEWVAEFDRGDQDPE